jgi:two-component system chemotaxis sensor kinase CheA
MSAPTGDGSGQCRVDELVREFLVESHENLDRLDGELLELERDPAGREALKSVFRTIHSLKGAGGFLGFARLEGVAHATENLLSRVRDGELTLSAEMMSALLGAVDVLREILDRIDTTGGEGTADYTETVDALTRLQPVPAAGAPPDQAAPAAWSAGAAAATGEGRAAAEGAEAPAPGAAVATATIRVEVGVLDRLVALVDELVAARGALEDLIASPRDQRVAGAFRRLELVTAELEAGVLRTRMQPVGTGWDKLPRLVRHLSHACGKQVRLEMEGKETELDKTILEAIRDPLTHLIRNCVDHGIETPDDRLIAEKPIEGRILLRARREAGEVRIEVADDGAGLDAERIRRRALDRGVLGAQAARTMSERELQSLIFLPGFSTAAHVSNISGRGVGMDVVKTHVERIGGTVDFVSRPGAGTTFRITIPLARTAPTAIGAAAAADPPVSLNLAPGFAEVPFDGAVRRDVPSHTD